MEAEGEIIQIDGHNINLLCYQGLLGGSSSQPIAKHQILDFKFNPIQL